MTTVKDHLDALGFTSDDHDANVREALLELRHARLSLAEFRKEREDEDRDIGDGQIIVSYDAWMACQRAVLSPPEPNVALLRAAASHADTVGGGRGSGQ